MKCVYNDAGRCNLFTNEWANGICTNNEDCPYRKPITNADKLRAMTDEELARFIARQRGWYAYEFDPEDEEYPDALDWLKQEADNG